MKLSIDFEQTFALQAYGKARTEGIDEIGALLLSISSDLLAFNFRETFVNAFDVRLLSALARDSRGLSVCCLQVSNKAAELLMRDNGNEVCCG